MALTRKKQAMPQFVRDALHDAQLMDAYKQRPPYQQNDYLGWINRAVRPETKHKRLAQMLKELKKGGVYMGMKHAASKKAKYSFYHVSL